jgi:hypothetical protein
VVIEHSLAQTLARVQALGPYLKPVIGIPEGSGWLMPTLDLAPGVEQLAILVAMTEERLRTRAVGVIGSGVLQAYQWQLIGTAIACYLLDRRVPELHPAQCRLHLNEEGDFDGLAFAEGRFIALPDDPAAGHPDVTIVPDRAALRMALHHQIVAHFGLVIDQLCTALCCKPRGLWLNVSDRCAGTFAWLMQAQAQAATPAMIEDEVYALVRRPGSPLNNRQVGPIVLECHSTTHLFLERATCCYWYKTEGGDYCSTCPHRTPEDRHERLLEYMAQMSIAVEEQVHD